MPLVLPVLAQVHTTKNGIELAKVIGWVFVLLDPVPEIGIL